MNVIGTMYSLINKRIRNCAQMGYTADIFLVYSTTAL